MRISARAPGKVAVLGEYAVLAGAPALVLAVDRYCHARIARSSDERCRLETLLPDSRSMEVGPDDPTNIALIDLVRGAMANTVVAPWDATLDSRAFFAGAHKLGLGSSAAALCAWAGAWTAWVRAVDGSAVAPTLGFLIDLHRRFQGGTGSGLDVAAAFTGGAIVFRLDVASMHQVGSVRLPNSVGFAGVFAGRSASTPDLVGRFHRWRADRPNDAAERQRAMEQIAESGCSAAERNESEEFLNAVDLYGRQLDLLGQAMGADIVTAEHRAIGAAAQRFGITYKVSGAGGGDLGLALSADGEALSAFKRAVGNQGYAVVDLRVDQHGLVVEEQT